MPASVQISRPVPRCPTQWMPKFIDSCRAIESYKDHMSLSWSLRAHGLTRGHSAPSFSWQLKPNIHKFLIGLIRDACQAHGTDSVSEAVCQCVYNILSVCKHRHCFLIYPVCVVGRILWSWWDMWAWGPRQRFSVFCFLKDIESRWFPYDQFI